MIGWKIITDGSVSKEDIDNYLTTGIVPIKNGVPLFDVVEINEPHTSTKTTEVPAVSEVNKLRKDLKAAVKRIEALGGKVELLMSLIEIEGDTVRFKGDIITLCEE